jgi:hypothetical protein
VQGVEEVVVAVVGVVVEVRNICCLSSSTRQQEQSKILKSACVKLFLNSILGVYRGKTDNCSNSQK